MDVSDPAIKQNPTNVYAFWIKTLSVIKSSMPETHVNIH